MIQNIAEEKCPEEGWTGLKNQMYTRYMMHQCMNYLLLNQQMYCCTQYYKTERVGKELKLMLNHSDLYVMSEKATGFDWHKRNIYTLRHAAGADKYTHAPLRAKLRKKEKEEA